MQIFINNKELDFELEEEKNMWDIFNGVKNWVSRGGRVITELVVDGKDYNIEEESLLKIAVDKVKNITFNVTDVNNLLEDSLKESVSYLDRLEEGLSSLSVEKLDQFIDGIRWFVEVIERAKKISPESFKNISDIDKKLNLLKKFTGVGNPGELDVKLVKDEISFWKDSLKIIIDQDSEKEKVNIKFLKKLKNKGNEGIEINNRIENIIVQLQTGNDLEAMNNIKMVGEYLEGVINLFKDIARSLNLNFSQIYIDNETVLEIIVKLTKLLNEIATVMKEEDIVILCDLLSYKLSPYMDRIRRVIDNIEKIISERAH